MKIPLHKFRKTIWLKTTESGKEEMSLCDLFLGYLTKLQGRNSKQELSNGKQLCHPQHHVTQYSSQIRSLKLFQPTTLSACYQHLQNKISPCVCRNCQQWVFISIKQRAWEGIFKSFINQSKRSQGEVDKYQNVQSIQPRPQTVRDSRTHRLVWTNAMSRLDERLARNVPLPLILSRYVYCNWIYFKLINPILKFFAESGEPACKQRAAFCLSTQFPIAAVKDKTSEHLQLWLTRRVLRK
jgi:hypothetical protein